MSFVSRKCKQLKSKKEEFFLRKITPLYILSLKINRTFAYY